MARTTKARRFTIAERVCSSLRKLLFHQPLPEFPIGKNLVRYEMLLFGVFGVSDCSASRFQRGRHTARLVDVDGVVQSAVKNPDGCFAHCFGKGGIRIRRGVERVRLSGHW